MIFSSIEVIDGIRISDVPLPKIVDELTQMMTAGQGLRIATVNAEMLSVASQDSSFCAVLSSAELCLPDGIGVVFLMRKLGYKDVKRIPGIELAWLMIEEAHRQKAKIALWGASADVLAATQSQLTKKFTDLEIVFAQDGYGNAELEIESIATLKKVDPQLVLVAMPFTKQEALLSRLRCELPKSILIGVGGSFDVWSGSVQRAPSLWQKLNLEWLWRLLKQRNRMARIATMLVGFARIYMRATKQPP